MGRIQDPDEVIRQNRSSAGLYPAGEHQPSAVIYGLSFHAGKVYPLTSL